MNNGKKTKGVMLLLVIAVILMTVGFAAYSQTLNINGNVTVKGSPWNVHYVSGTVTPSANSVTATSASVTNTDFTFDITLTKPGDFYEATVTVKNEGAITAYLKTLTMSTLTTEQAKYLTYTVTYDSTAYTQTTTGIQNVSLAPNATVPVKVRVAYKSDAAQTDLPASDVTVTVSGNLDYSSED